MARYALFVLAALMAVAAVAGQDTCPIQACASGCEKKQLKGQSTRLWTCKTCASGYTRSADGRACVCPPGKYESAVSATSGTCSQCPQGSYCAGGAKSLVDDGTKTSADRGPIASCDTTAANFDTVPAGKKQKAPASVGLNSPAGARKIAQCFTQPGYYMANVGSATTQAATECPADSFNAGGNRAKSCTSCPSGLKTQGAAAGKTKKGDCLVPPGYYWNTRASKPLKQCDKGTFRGTYTKAFADSVCDKCADGVTTDAAGKTADTDCVVLKAGYAWKAGSAPISDTEQCAIGTWSAERTLTADNKACTACGTGKTTQYLASDAATDCVDNAASDDVAVTCPADGSNYGFNRIDNAAKPKQQFQVSSSGAVTSIDVFIWGPESGATTAASYSLDILDTDGTTVLASSTNSPSAAKTACANAENIDNCDGDFRTFNFNNVALDKANVYTWRLTCNDNSGAATCGFYGYCNYDALAGLDAFEGTTTMDQDDAFQVTLVPNDAALKRI